MFDIHGLSGPVLFLKATVKKKIWIPAFVKKNGRAVGGYFKDVHVTDDHDDHQVARGGISASQQEAHKKLHKLYADEPGFHALPKEDQAKHIMVHATDIQDKWSVNREAGRYIKDILAGKTPSDNRINAFLSVSEGKKKALFEKLRAAGEGFVDVSAKAIAGYLEKTGKTLKDFQPKDDDAKEGADGTLVFKNGRRHKQAQAAVNEKPVQEVAAAGEEASGDAGVTLNHVLAALEQAKLPETNSNWKTVNKKIDALIAAAKAGDIAAIEAMTFGVNTYGKKLKAFSEKLAASLKEAGASNPADTQSASAPQNGDNETLVSYTNGETNMRVHVHRDGDKFSVTLFDLGASEIADVGSAKSYAEATAKAKQMAGLPADADPDGYKVQDANAAVEKEPTLDEKMADAGSYTSAKAVAEQHIADNGGTAQAYVEALDALEKQGYQQAVSELIAEHAVMGDSDSPKEGDTKQGADGMLVFENGRWHKQGGDTAKSPEDQAAGAWEIQTFTHSKKGHTVHAAQIPKKLSDDEYKAAAALAKEHGGFYSSYAKDGAIKGFHFKTDEAAQAFAAAAGEKFGGSDEHVEAPIESQSVSNEQIKAEIDKLYENGEIGDSSHWHINSYLTDYPGDLAGIAKQLKHLSYHDAAAKVEALAKKLGIHDRKDSEAMDNANDSAWVNEGKGAPVGTKASYEGSSYTKTPGGWKNDEKPDGEPLSKKSFLAAYFDIVSGTTPADEFYDEQSVKKKDFVVEELIDQGGMSATGALNKVYPIGKKDGPQEGDIKTINGVQYQLINGRWHKVGDDQKPAAAAAVSSLEEALNAVPIPEYVGVSSMNKQKLEKALEQLKKGVLKDGAGAFKGVVKKNPSKAKLYLKFPANYDDGFYGLSAKAWIDFNADGSIDPNQAMSVTSKGVFDTYQYIEALKAAHEKVSGKAPKKKAAKKPAAEAAPKQSVVAEVVSDGVTKIDSWEKVGEPKGSNPGGAFIDKSGKQWYCKFPSNPDVVRNELLAAKFYEMMGVPVPNLKLVEKDGKLGIASKWVDGLKAVSAGQLAKAADAHEAFAIDAWLGNWDVIGLTNDNMMLNAEGKAVRVDVGGSLLYRAQGEAKGDKFGNEVTELKTLLDPSINGTSAAVFSGISKEALEVGAKKVAKMKPEQIRKMVQMFGPGDEEEKNALIDKLIARRRSIIDQSGVEDPWDTRAIDDTRLQVNPEDLPEPHDFHNWNGTGKGLSGSKYYNDLNAKAEQDIMTFAKKGNLQALKSYQYMKVNKETGAEEGLKPIDQHPSQYVQALWSECVSVLDQLAHPSIESFDLPGVSGALDDIVDAAGFFKFGDSIDSVGAEKRFGFWLKLSHAVDVDDIVPKAVTVSIGSIKSKGQEWFSKVHSLTKKMVHGIQSSGTYNDAFRDGKAETKDGHSTVKMTAQAYADAIEMDEGTELYKWIHLPPAMQNLLNNAEKGLILQNPGSMCCSVHPTNTSHFGPHRMKIRYAKGAKGLNSFGSGNFSSEEEITTLPGARFMVLSVNKGNPKGGGMDIELLMLPPAAGYLDELEKKAQLIKSMIIFLTRKGYK